MRRSIWVTDPAVAGPALDHDAHAEVCVVGGGIAGTSIAYRLAREGRSVVLVDDGEFPGGETSRTSAHLVTALDRGYATLERLHGTDGARHAAESHAAAIALIEETVAAAGIACDFERLDGYLCGASDEVDEEFEAARRAGLPVERCSAPTAAFARGACIRFPAQAQFHPLRYVAHLADAFARRGGRLFTHTHAARIESADDGAARVVTAAGPVVTADAVVVATNTPVNYQVALHTKQAPYRTYLVALRVPRGSVAPALYWDTDEPFHYVRLVRTPDAPDELLLVGGEDHKTGQELASAERAYERLEDWARRRVRDAGPVEQRWSGQVMESIDGLAFIGRTEEHPNVYVVTGDSGNGLTHGTIASVLLTDQIQGRPNPWAALYDPSRLTLRALGTFVRENANVAAQLTEWMRPSSVRDAQEIAPGSGAVVHRGLSRVAVYRDASGNVHERSAVCPHLRCIVRWNTVESTWDCPCHGSRFDPYGAVVNGPANSGLDPLGDDAGTTPEPTARTR
jgi:glycine/D-amino acid oxidase-like deaminating enzyme/nitrite reductase/ring-hydroxylating ferredoxin subunit